MAAGWPKIDEGEPGMARPIQPGWCSDTVVCRSPDKIDILDWKLDEIEHHQTGKYILEIYFVCVCLRYVILCATDFVRRSLRYV